jgi:hypothetical protein
MPKIASRVLVPLLLLSIVFTLSCSKGESTSGEDQGKGEGDTVEMTLAERNFWDLIQESIKASDGTIEGQLGYLEVSLAARTEEEIIAFEFTLRDVLRQSYHYNVMALLKVIDGWITDDTLLYFECRLILYGPDTFYAVIENPNNLTERLDSGQGEAEWLLSLADRAFMDKFGEDTDKTLPRDAAIDHNNYDFGYPMLGEPWNSEDFEEHYGPLLKLYEE